MLNTFYKCQQTNKIDFLHGFHQCGIWETPAGSFKSCQPWTLGPGTCKIVHKVRERHIYIYIYIYTLHPVCIDMNIPGPQPLLFAGGSCCYFGDGGKGWMDHPKAKSRAKQCHPVGHSYAGHLYLCLLQIYLNFNNCESFDAFF